MIVSIIQVLLTWGAGIVLKKWPQVANDLIPQITLILSMVLEVLKNAVMPTPVEASDGIPVPLPPGVALPGLVNWACATGIDWLLNKILMKRVFGKKLY